MRAYLLPPILILALIAVACGTTVNADKGVEMDGPQAVISLFPACPDLPKDPAAAKEIVMAWLGTLEKIAGSLPAGLSATITATIERNASGAVDAAADVRSTIEATVQDALKDFYKVPGT